MGVNKAKKRRALKEKEQPPQVQPDWKRHLDDHALRLIALLAPALVAGYILWDLSW